MKKQFFLLLFMLAGISFSGAAQNIIGGAGLRTIVGNESWKTAIGAHLSCEPKIHHVGKGGFTAGIGATLQGAKWDEGGDIGQGEGNYNIKGVTNLYYLIIPLLYQHYLTSSLYAEGGLQPMLLLAAREKLDGGKFYNVKEYMNAFNLALIAGMVYRLQNGLGVGARFSYGMLGLYKNTDGKTDRTLLLTAMLSYQLSSLNLCRKEKK
ncbi:MAG TPA: outer membrane beta-barrel protein [Ferruginibacter sp.]|nr:outer membrane beta-barrel protein [Ferruginibacter sp.]HMP21285.1 outer membrane beta-barrel protein [Ferruginibacter sp.]